MKAIPEHPALWQAYQNADGFFGARVKAIVDHLTLRSGKRVIDISCRSGYILRHLPPGIDCVGFDIDQAHIDHARRAFGHLGQFHCRYCDAAAAREFAGTDVVMMTACAAPHRGRGTESGRLPIDAFGDGVWSAIRALC
jgi:SAM-dependent methyltransferase